MNQMCFKELSSPPDTLTLDKATFPEISDELPANGVTQPQVRKDFSYLFFDSIISRCLRGTYIGKDCFSCMHQLIYVCCQIFSILRFVPYE